ncbi:MAG TPA: protein kinase [Gemmatimonadaceae bacterium]|jgi:serine/threonine-protein kinase
MTERLEQVQRAFSAYTIERELGSGGMATVYLAHDKKHDRKVAIKILHAELAAVLGAERFLQEIRVTANLQHPHILGLIDSGIVAEGELQGRPYYVMPFIRGESLRERLNKEQQLPVSDAVRIATEVASALDYAHREGVVHRDIKPENILLHDGSAIVADFGIALAVTQAGGARMTQTGLSLGTPSYMSPEQAMGERAITARSDIYSLGAVTYEMLSGEPPFTGPTVQAVVARVMTEEPRPLTTVRRNAPPHVAAAVSHALEKVPADRFASAHEFAEALNNPSFTLSSAAGAVVGRDRSSRRLRRLLYGVTALAILTTATTLWGWMRPAAPKQVVRYSLVFDSAEAMAQSKSGLALSPDGSRLAYIGGPGAQLLIRPRNQLRAIAMPGTEGAMTPFFSPDGQHVGFVTGRNLQVVSLNGGPPITVTDSLVGVAGASWGRDGFIYADGHGYVSLVRVEAKSGAVPKWFTVLDTARGEFDHTWPDVLPNGKGVLFTVTFNGKNAAIGKTSHSIAVAEIPSGKHRVIVDDAMYARYATSGHLLYVTTNKTLMVVPFDQNSMKITGEPTALIEGMRLGSFGADLAVSATGTLMYATGAGEGKQELVWVTRDGKAQSVDSDWQGLFGSPALSPDGKRLAVGQTNDIWIKQLDRGPSIKLTLDGKENVDPTWTPDGRSVTFSSNAAGSIDLWTKRADGSAQAVLQFHEKREFYNARWSPGGKWLIFRTYRFAADSGDILGIRPGIDTAPVPLVATKFTEVSPAFSPDGRWLAYTSNESGQYEIYVVPFPNTGAAKWAVSTREGTEPRWSHSGSELFYRDLGRNFVAVEVKNNPTFSLGRSTALFPAGGFASDEREPQYDVSSDDRRFLMIRPVAASSADKLIMVENWFEELKAKPRK